MARKAKIPNEIKKRFVRTNKKREQNVRVKRKYFLIVCEGERTEPNYFESLKQDLPNGILATYQIDIEGTGRNTQSLIDEALRIKSKYESDYNRKIDKIWAVFDKDSFSANDFNNAILRCKNASPKIGCAWSNEAFELWYLLHFHYYNSPISRKDYQHLIEENLQPYIGKDYKYEKNSKVMYSLLKKHGSLENAIRNAIKLREIYGENSDFANQNPRTEVYLLITELLKLKKY